MGRPSKYTQGQQKNLQRRDRTKKTTVEDIMDLEDKDEEYCPPTQPDLLDEGFFFLDEESDSDSNSEFGDDEIEEDELKELQTEQELHLFNSILAEAQAVAIQAEKELAESKPKRKRYYTGNSARTVRQYALKRRQLEAKGQRFINSWFEKQEKGNSPVVQPLEDVNEEAEQSEDELDEPEIEERINRVFSEPIQVRQSVEVGKFDIELAVLSIGYPQRREQFFEC